VGSHRAEQSRLSACDISHQAADFQAKKPMLYRLRRNAATLLKMS
jgi:hypothetical protein